MSTHTPSSVSFLLIISKHSLDVLVFCQIHDIVQRVLNRLAESQLFTSSDQKINKRKTKNMYCKKSGTGPKEVLQKKKNLSAIKMVRFYCPSRTRSILDEKIAQLPRMPSCDWPTEEDVA